MDLICIVEVDWWGFRLDPGPLAGRAVVGSFNSLCVFVLQNQSINGHYKNTSFMCADVTSQDLVIQANSIDLIFSNWLLMYLSDEEVMGEPCFE